MSGCSYAVKKTRRSMLRNHIERRHGAIRVLSTPGPCPWISQASICQTRDRVEPLVQPSATAQAASTGSTLVSDSTSTVLDLDKPAHEWQLPDEDFLD